MVTKIKNNAKKGGRVLAEATPFIGEILENLDSEASGKGKIAWGKLAIQALRVGVLWFLASKGVQIPI